MTTPIFFRSGLSRLPDFAAAVLAGVPAGISLAEASPALLRHVELHLERGGQVFVDSGAFTAFRCGSRLMPEEFEQILATYRRLAAHAQPDCLFVAAPDVIGDQTSTRAAMAEYAPVLRELAAAGVVILFPLQKGDLSLADLHAEVSALVPSANFCPALPCNAAAVSSDEVIEFLSRVQPPRAHFLGAAWSQRFRNLLTEASALCPTCKFSYDAAVIRALTGQLRRDDAQVQEQSCEALAAGLVDEGELAEAIRGGGEVFAFIVTLLTPAGGSENATKQQIEALAEAKGCDRLEAIEHFYPAFEALWFDFVTRWTRQHTARTWRTRALAGAAKFAHAPEIGAALAFA